MAPQRERHDLIEALRTLADDVLSKAPPKEIVALKKLLLEAREQPISDKQQFVDLVNTILRATGHRIRLPDGAMCLLCVRPGKTGAGYIQLQPQVGGSRGGFTTENLDLVLGVTAQELF